MSAIRPLSGVVRTSASDCRTIAIYQYTPWPTAIIADVLLIPNPRRKVNRIPQKWEEAMIRKAFWSLAIVLLACSSGSAADVRRVVTGLDASNKAVVLFDSRVTLNPGGSGNPAANLWITDSSPPALSFKDDNAAKGIGLSPPDNGTAIRVVEFPPLDPAAEAKMDPNFMMKVVGDHAPARGLPVKHPLMHRTRTVDYAIILSGEIDMMLDETTVHVKGGDVVIQQATNHAWVNRGTQPCRILFVLMDSKQP
jgi:mannose-6-phosphate isomerase-like protein (cupin superfamily)